MLRLGILTTHIDIFCERKVIYMSIKMNGRRYSISKELHKVLGDYVNLVVSATENLIVDEENRYELRHSPLSFLLGIFSEDFTLFEKIADLNAQEIKVVASYVDDHAKRII